MSPGQFVPFLSSKRKFQYRLESFTEARSTTETTEAVNAAALLDHGGGSADPWDYEVLPDHMFVDQVTFYPVLFP